MLLNPYRFAAGGGGGGDTFRYWRLNAAAVDGSLSYVSFAELALFTSVDGTGTNLALSKTAVQTGDGAGGLADKGNDGSVFTECGSSFPLPYQWTVDLAADFTIKSAKLTSHSSDSGRTPHIFKIQGAPSLSGPWSNVFSEAGSRGWSTTETRVFRADALKDRLYWRFKNIVVPGTHLDLTEWQLFNAGTRVDAPTAVITSSDVPSAGSLSGLNDGNFGSGARWTQAVAQASGFDITFCFGDAPSPTDGDADWFVAVNTAASSTAVDSVIRSHSAISGGRFYWEADVIATAGGTLRVGIHQAGVTRGTGYQFNWAASGALYPGGASAPTYTAGDRLMFALDAPLGALWVGVNGTWHGATPAAGYSTGAAFTSLPSVTWNKAVFRTSANATLASIRTCWEAVQMAYMPPEGFQRFPGTARPIVDGFKIAGAADSTQFPTACEVESSNDGVTWESRSTVAGMAYAGAGVLSPTYPAVGGGGGPITTAGLVFSLDAGDAGSYGGSGQTWANTVAVPADGSTQAGNDFYLGATSGSEGSDPTFTGSAGSGSAYWAFDGGDYFTFAAGSASTAFLKALHQSGAKFTLEAWVYHSGAVGGNVNPVFSSGCSDQGGADVSRGVVFADFGTLVTASGKRNCIRVKRDGGGSNALAAESASDLSTGWHMLACSIDGTGAQNSFLYTDGGYDAVGGNSTWDGTFATPGSTDPANPPRIGDRGDGGFRLPNGSRVAVFRVYNTNLTKAELDANWTATRSRYGL